MIYYLDQTAAEPFVDKDKDGDIELGKTNRPRFGGKAIIYPLGLVETGPQAGMVAFTDTKGEALPVIVPEPEPEPVLEPETPPVARRVPLGCNIGAGAMGSAGLTYGINYLYPPREEWELAAEFGMKVARYPVRYRRIKNLDPGIAEPAMDPAVAKYLLPSIDVGLELGFHIIIEEHGYGAGPRRVLKADGVTTGGEQLNMSNIVECVAILKEAFAKYKDNDKIAFSMSNEPHIFDTATEKALYWQIAQEYIDLFRGKDGDPWTNEIVIGSTGYSALSKFDGSPCDFASTLFDPLGKLVIDVHQYVDSDTSGTHWDECMGTKSSSEELTDERAWKWINDHLTPSVNSARVAGLKLLIGEFGIPDTVAGRVATRVWFEWMHQNADVIKYATWFIMSNFMPFKRSSPGGYYSLSQVSKFAPSPILKRIAALG